jgi:hypothetical protein
MKTQTSKLIGTSNDNHWRNNKINALIAIGMALGIGSAVAQTGNGALSGPHYNLNIIGTTQCPGDDMVGTMQHVIFVELFGGDNPNGQLASAVTPKNKIYLIEGDTFQVLDGNACDGRAEFQLPAPGDSQIFIRPLGQPGGSETITTCATDAGPDLVFGTADDVIVCSSGNVILTRDKGQSKFVNVTDELTTVVLADGTVVSLFDPALIDFFWNVQNDGLRLAQLRFYPIL